MKLSLITVLLLSCSLLKAQAVKEFYDKNGKPTDEQQSYFYRVGKTIVKKRETVFIDTVKTFYTATNKIRSREFYLKGLKDGAFTTYYENGRLKDKGTYHQGLEDGDLTSWYETGNIQRVMNIREGRLEIISYWNESNVQLVKDGSGYCSCYLYADKYLKKGKVVNGMPDSTWQYLSGDTVKYIVEFSKGKVLKVTKPSLYPEVNDKGLETPAEFPGGTTALMKFLAKNIRYPSYSRRMGVEGTVYTKFIVEMDGMISDITIMKGINYDLNEEAIRVIKSMPRWVPASKQDVPIRSQALLPISFKLAP
jgi:TonB family protein